MEMTGFKPGWLIKTYLCFARIGSVDSGDTDTNETVAGAGRRPGNDRGTGYGLMTGSSRGYRDKRTGNLSKLQHHLVVQGVVLVL